MTNQIYSNQIFILWLLILFTQKLYAPSIEFTDEQNINNKKMAMFSWKQTKSCETIRRTDYI